MKIRTPIKPVHVKRKHYWLEAIIVISSMLGAYLLAGYIDTQVALDVERANVLEAEQHRDNCFNGLGKWVFEDGSEVACYKAETNGGGIR
jgi:hypothetical protein